MFRTAISIVIVGLGFLPANGQEKIGPDQIFRELRSFYAKTALPNGSFLPNPDPKHPGMSDSAASDMAPPTYAVIVHKTFGWTLPHEEETKKFFLSRQRPDGAFVNKNGTMDPHSPHARLYNTTQALVALNALGVKPKYDGLAIFEAILKEDYKTFPAYSTSFFPLAYAAAGKTIPKDADAKIRALMVQEKDGYMHNHIASTFHLAHYYTLVGEKTPMADAIVARCLKDQAPDGSWMINPLARDRHATFDAVFTLLHLGKDSAECKKAIARAAEWALRCRNSDGGFGHYPGSPSDADAVYFQIGTLVMAGFLRPAENLPPNAKLWGWGHLMPRR